MDEEQSADPGMTCYCPMDDILSVISKRYAMQLVGVLHAHGTMRSNEIADALGNPSAATFSKRLDELEEAGLLDREQYDEIPPRVEYSLTRRGEELADRLQPMLEWAAEN